MSSIGEVVVTEDSSLLVHICTVVYISFVIFGTFTVFLFVAVLIKGNSVFKEFPFFTIVWNLTSVNLIAVLIQLTCIVPSMFFDYPEDSLWATWYSLGSNIITLCETSSSTLVFLIALNRFSVFVFKPLARAFTSENIKYPILLAWLYILVMSYLRIFCMRVVVRFSRKTFHFTDVFMTEDGPINTIVASSSYIIPGLVFVMYLIMYLFLQKKRSSLNSIQETNNNDINLLFQGFLLAISIIIWRTMTTISPRMDVNEGWLEYILILVRSLSSVVNNILNPILFFATNITVKKTLKRLIKCESMEPKVTSDSDIPTARRRALIQMRLKLFKKRASEQRNKVEPIITLSNMDQEFPVNMPTVTV